MAERPPLDSFFVAPSAAPKRPPLESFFDAPQKEEMGTLEDVGRSGLSGLVKGIHNLIDFGASGVATLADEAGQAMGVMPKRSLGETFGGYVSQQNVSKGLDTLLNTEEHTPQTTAGRYANFAGQAVATLPLAGANAAIQPANVARAVGGGVGAGVGGDAGGAVGEFVGGDTGRKVGTVVGSLAGGSYGGYKAGQGVESFERGLSGKAPPSKALNADELREKASELYRKSEESGALLSKNVTNNFIAEANKKLVPQTAMGKVVAGETESTKLASRLASLVDKPMTLREAQEIDEYLGDIVDGMTELGKLTKEGKRVYDLQSSLRKAIETAPDSDIIGKAGVDALKEGRELWARQARLRDIEKIITRAEMTDNPATAIKTGFRNLVTNPQRTRGFSKEEIVALERAAKSGIVTDTLRVFGSRLIPIMGATTGGIPGAIAGQVGSMASRGLATKAQLNRALDAADLVSRGGAAPNTLERAGMGLRDLFGGPSSGVPPMSPGVAQGLGAQAPVMSGPAASMSTNMQPAQRAAQQRSIKVSSNPIAPASAIAVGGGLGVLGAKEAVDSTIGQQQPSPQPQGPDEIGTLLASLENQQVEQDRSTLTQMMDAPPPTTTFLDKIMKAESGGDRFAKSTTSSALGPFQFTRKTWRNMLDKYAPDELKNHPNAMQLRTDPQLARYMAQKLADDNASALSKKGVPVTDGSLYVSHFAGGPRAARMYTANPKAPATKFFAPFEIEANKSILKDKNIGQVIAILEKKVK